MFVGERNGRAVELQLADELRPPDLLLDAADELVQFVERVGVAQREHREAVCDACELGRQIAAYACRGGVGVGVLGVCALQLLQFAHQGVEFEIGDFGCVVDVIFTVMIFELPSQLLDSVADHIAYIFMGKDTYFVPNEAEK